MISSPAGSDYGDPEDEGPGPAAARFFAAMRELYIRKGRPTPKTLAPRSDDPSPGYGKSHITQIVLGRLLPPRWGKELSNLVLKLDGDESEMRQLWVDAHLEREREKGARPVRRTNETATSFAAEVRQIRNSIYADQPRVPVEMSLDEHEQAEFGVAEERWQEVQRLMRSHDVVAAELALQPVLTAYGDILGYGAVQTIEAWHMQAELRRQQDGPAVDILRELLRRQRGGLGDDDARVQATRRDIALLLVGTGEFDEALDMLVEVRAIGSGAGGRDTAIFAKADLVSLLERDGRWEQAAEVLEALIPEARRLADDALDLLGTLERQAERIEREIAARKGTGRHARRRDEVVHLQASANRRTRKG